MILNIFSHTPWLFKYIFCDLSQYFAYLLIGLFSYCIIRVTSSLPNISQIISPVLYLVFSSFPWYFLTTVTFNFKGPVYQFFLFWLLFFWSTYLRSLVYLKSKIFSSRTVPTTFRSMTYFNLILMCTVR